MIARNTIEEDIHLKEVVRQSKSSNQPRFEWLAPAGGTNGQQLYSCSDVSKMIGDALTNLLLARQEQDIFNEKNQQLVSTLSAAVSRELESRGGDQSTLTHREITRLIERAMIQHNAYDVARAFITSYASGNHHQFVNQMAQDSLSTAGDIKPSLHRPVCRIIRRNGEVVAWDENKVEIAVRKAFLSQHLDSSPAEDIARSLTAQFRASGQHLINIEDFQDRVQEELMKQGHYKVAAAYILFRAERAAAREAGLSGSETDSTTPFVAPESTAQGTMIVVKKADGTNAPPRACL